jgi:hypothetical protein
VPKIIKHPVMGWVVIILMATIVAIPPTYFLVSPSAARWVEIGGMLIALNFGIGAVLLDFCIVRRRRGS